MLASASFSFLLTSSVSYSLCDAWHTVKAVRRTGRPANDTGEHVARRAAGSVAGLCLHGKAVLHARLSSVITCRTHENRLSKRTCPQSDKRRTLLANPAVQRIVQDRLM